MSGILLHLQDEFLLCSGPGVRLGSAVGGKHHPGKRRKRIGLAIDHHQRPWRDKWKHGRAVEFGIDTWHNALIKSTHELRVERRALAPGGSLDGGPDRSHSRLPCIVLEGPTE